MSKTVYYNGIVYTSNPDMPVASSFVFENGKFLYVGNDEHALDYGRGTDLKGACVIPGMVDSHCHILSCVLKSAMNMLVVPEDTKPDQLENAILHELEVNGYGPDEIPKIIRVMGIDYTIDGFNYQSIGQSFQDCEVYIFSYDGHAMLMNKKAMEVCGITNEKESLSKDSYYAKDSDGNVNGWAVEMLAIHECAPYFSPKIGIENVCTYENVQKKYRGLGYTTVFDAASVQGEANLIEVAKAACEQSGSLRLRLSVTIPYYGEEMLSAEETIELACRFRSLYENRDIHVNTIKMIADGTVEEHTGHLSFPYNDEPGNVGSRLLSTEEITEMVKLAVKEDFSVHVHAIGDRAAEDTLQAFSDAGDYENDATLTVAHNQLYNSVCFSLLKKLADTKHGIYFQSTPHWVVEDSHSEQFLGKERAIKQFPFKTAIKNGAYVSFGGDTTADDYYENPFIGIYYAVKRNNPETEAITRQEALNAYTIWGAKQLGMERECGSIEVGKDADFVIISDDILNIPEEEIKNISVKQCFFRGNCE